LNERLESKHCYVIYRDQMLKLLAARKSPHDQLCIALPCLMGFRSEEVTTWKAEHIDFDNGDTFVMDAKKHRLFKVPLNIQVAACAEKVLEGRTEGYVVENESTAWRNRAEPLSVTAIWYLWKRNIEPLNLANASEISPIVGRRFFAAEWFYNQHLSLVTLSMLMRHADVKVTLEYVRKLIFYHDLKKDYLKFQFGIEQPVSSLSRAEQLVEII